MHIDILLEILRAIGRFFINPIVYMTIFLTIFLGYRRVKKERKSFNIRILSGWSELKNSILASLLVSFIVSIVIIAVGLTMTPQFLLILMAVTMIGLVLYTFHLLSPIVLFALSAVALVILGVIGKAYTIVGVEISGVIWQDGTIVPICIVAGLLVIAEGVLIRRYGASLASPILEKTKRGLQAVSYFSKQVWVLPLFVLIPGEVIPSYIPYWPQFTIGEQAFGLMLFPFVIGFQQLTRKTLPVYFYPKLAKSIIWLGSIVVLGGIGAYFVPEVAFVVLMLGALMRLFIALRYKLQDRDDVYAVAPSPIGATIAAVLPNSPAEKMGLLTGEVIKKVNGREVQTERELYEALQVNAAHCKLEVLDHKKELRLTQHVVHSDDHYRIGLLLAR
ncbi:PDZ domain-containing protein [Lysinibacillus sp. KU-BSD001]|uniref:PDZ domain-containing protein n=1 Tax=Lysinibacillus sp. KU-BSD001 TaxID=3141328 RepID=UPI0036E1B69E